MTSCSPASSREKKGSFLVDKLCRCMHVHSRLSYLNQVVRL
uniref:Uncharacterized protein n=1 Tax=Arundo donax TaxID=35708 RepID=A0A0A9BM15_ARUDO